ncbi:hypothetical protein IEQ34_021412 [Dendrobium chrysotoxum]|uniref:Uncharacterized protein n=1 Tax=Dendrobium chrysotoxum TaxID=161865 RepID=A0AAV7FLT4_DENCH|nr:hypothetical protein IEQ34_021412 [Dendrobium chrysotoxum]
MTQVDLETLLCGGDVKVACETMMGGEDAAAKRQEEDPDMPAESIQIRIGEEIDWTDINAVYERDDSTKGNTNPKSQHANQKQQQQQQQQPPSNSQRFSGNLKPKAPIIALPNKIRHSSYLGASARRLPKGRALLKKKRGGGDRKSALPPPEPGSPKVSCFGKVLSDRERERSHHIRPAFAPSTVDDKDWKHRRSGGCFARLIEMFRCRRPSTRECEEDEEAASTPPEKIVSWSGRPSAATAMEGSSVATPAGLGAIRRFSSGRRPASWGGDEDIDGQMHVTSSSSPLDQEGMIGRRSVG